MKTKKPAKKVGKPNKSVDVEDFNDGVLVYVCLGTGKFKNKMILHEVQIDYESGCFTYPHFRQWVIPIPKSGQLQINKENK